MSAPVPTVTIKEISKGIQDYESNSSVKKVLEGILNDYMELQYGQSTPYTTGKTVLPNGTTIEDVKLAISSNIEKKFNDIFVRISETHESGDLTPQSVNDGTWSSELTPVLVFLRPDN